MSTLSFIRLDFYKSIDRSKNRRSRLKRSKHRILGIEQLEFRAMLASDLSVEQSHMQNPVMPSDTNGDAYFSDLDVLVVVNWLNRESNTNGAVSEPPQFALYPDVNGDQIVSYLDLLIQINGANRASFTASERVGSTLGSGEGCSELTIGWQWGTHNAMNGIGERFEFENDEFLNIFFFGNCGGFQTAKIEWGDGSIENFLMGGTVIGSLHEYLDDDPTGTKRDYYDIVVTAGADDVIAIQHIPLFITNRDPRVMITSITPNDRQMIDPITGQTIILNPGEFDESEGFRVQGNVYDNPNDSHIGTITADLNFDGDTHDAGESVSIGLGPFDILFSPVLDDGPSPGNDTMHDVINISIEIVDDDTGIGIEESFVIVNNVDPAFAEIEPQIVPCFDSVGQLISVHVLGAFTDVGTMDDHTLNVEWGDGFLQSLFVPAGTYTYSVMRFLSTEILSLPELLTLFLVLQDDDLGITTKTIGGTNGCPAESDLPAWVDKRHQMFLTTNPTPQEGHRAVTINDFSQVLPLTDRYANTRTTWSPQGNANSPMGAHALKVKMIDESRVDTLQDYLTEAEEYWKEYKELDKDENEALAIAKKVFKKVIKGDSPNCWMTVAKFDDATIDTWVKMALDPAGTYRTPLFNAQTPLPQARILLHEQDHMDATEAFVKVFRAELKTMHATVFSPYPSPRVPDRYRIIAQEMLISQMKSRSTDLFAKMGSMHKRLHTVAEKWTAPSYPAIQKPLPALASSLARNDADPNCILEAPVFPISVNSYRNPTDVCESGVKRTLATH